jgi:pilus assembly protein CpaB
VSVRTVLIVILALVFGISAAVGVGMMRGPFAQAATETVPVVVAAADVARFSTVTASHLTTRNWPKELVPPGAVTSIEEATDRVALIPLVKGETIHESKLAGRGSGRGLAPGIEKGKRAFTIQTPNVASGVAGFILPGNKVDVLLTVSGQGDEVTKNGVTITLLQNVEILAVDQRVEVPADNKVDARELRSVTLLVTPHEAGRLDLGQNKGTLHLSLRNPEDTQYVTTRKATLAEIGLQEEKLWDVPRAGSALTATPPPEPTPQPFPIRTLRGTQEGAVLVYPAAPR